MQKLNYNRHGFTDVLCRETLHLEVKLQNSVTSDISKGYKSTLMSHKYPA